MQPPACSPRLAVVGILLLASVAGCRTLPESGVNTFATSTSTLQLAISSAGNAAVQDLATLHTDTPASKAAAQALSEDLKQQWDKRLRVMAAMNTYAASLQRLVDAGKAGQQNAAAFTGALRELVTATQMLDPAAPAIDLALNLSSRVYGEIAADIAAGRIARALAQADPIVAGTSAIIASDLLNLRSIALEKRRTALSSLQTAQILGEFRSLNHLRDAAATAAFSSDTPTPAALDQLQKIQQMIITLSNDPAYLQYLASRDQINQLFKSQTDLLDQASLTVAAWARSHHELLLGIEQKKAPSLQQLSTFASDLYDIYKKYREARSTP